MYLPVVFKNLDECLVRGMNAALNQQKEGV